MPNFAKHCMKGATAAFLLLCGTAQTLALEPDGLELARVSVYTETGRDIYLAGLRLPPGSHLEGLPLTPPPRAMEYRLATRRLSGRGFAGMLLLQAELGREQRAPDGVVGVLTELKRQLKGSLRRGDRFVILNNEAGETVFLLNEIELHRVPDDGVFDFFLSGWIGEGVGTAIRAPLMAGNLNEATAARFEALGPSEERIAAIGGWVAPDPVIGAVATAEAAFASAEGAATSVGASAAADDTMPVNRTDETSAADTSTNPTAGILQAAERPQPMAPIPEPLLVDSVIATGPEAAPQPAPGQNVAATLPIDTLKAMDDREYQRQLQEYVSGVMRLVYGEVKYPRRAIKFQWEGRVELSARLDKTGDLLEVVVDNSSGHAGLDRAAAAAIERAAPFPELTPVVLEELSSEAGDGYVMSIPITFALRR